MSSYRQYGPTVQMNAQAVSSTSVYTTSALDISSFQSFSYQAVWTGTPTGAILVLVSNDGVNFKDLGASVSPNPSGSADGTMIHCYGVPAKWAKLQYTNASGSGTLTVTAVGKTR